MGERVRGWWYPYIFIGMLGLVMAVNGAMAYFATSTFNGVITENAYEKGLTYNKTLAVARQQSELGWKVDAEAQPAAAGHKATVTLTYRDKDGRGLDGLEVQALVDRPNVTGAEHRIAFAAKGNGAYAIDVDLPEGGQWDFDILAVGADATYQVQRRFVIP